MPSRLTEAFWGSRLIDIVGFELQERVGGGEIAEVWRANPTGADAEQLVALKVGRSRTAAPLLADEALHASLALSERLPELLALGWLQIDGEQARVVDRAHLRSTRAAAAEARPAAAERPFIALRWAPGRPISTGEKVESREARLLATLELARDAGQALADLHGAGLAHGDVKPANLIRAADGRVALIDLGLAAAAYDTKLRGATPRYLAAGDVSLGDARARDLLALGVVLAELADDDVAAAPDPVSAARATALPASIASLCRALLAPSPGARPSARWVEQTAAALLGRDEQLEPSRLPRQLRATYLRVRRHELELAESTRGAVAPWLPGAVAVAVRARAMGRVAAVSVAAGDGLSAGVEQLGPLDPERRSRWLAALVGSPATAWASRRIAEADEPALVDALVALGARRRPSSWTLTEVERALTSRAASSSARASGARAQPTAVAAQGSLELGRADDPIDADAAAQLSLRVGRIPFDDEAAEVVERLASRLPDALVLATADALRLAGELGRARSLVMGRQSGRPVAADILRRAGDRADARALAQACLEGGDDPEGRARACLARIHLDDGQLDEAEALVQAADSAPVAEVAALVCARRGDPQAALELVERGMALAVSAEQRARLAAAAAFVRFPAESRAARASYRAAVAHAVQAGAVPEEASYRTGEAAACVDLGELEAGIATAQRAAVLWEEVLGRRGMAARALLACAAAYATVEARLEAVRAGEQAARLAREAGDDRARAYALWCIADACSRGDPRGRAAATDAAPLVGIEGAPESKGDRPPNVDLDDDGLHGLARLWRYGSPDIDAQRRAAVDGLAGRSSPRGAAPRLAWWGARAERLCASDEAVDESAARTVLAQLVALADQQAPVGAKGVAMYAGCRLAGAIGDAGSASTLDHARAEAARAVLAGCPTVLAEAARACEWLSRSTAGDMRPEQARDLQRLVRALGERGGLRSLLDRVVDVLVMWTGAERGLLLLRNEAGQLVPRSARNLSRIDLDEEQLTVSRSLAQRALETAEPVVAIDAMKELSDSHKSVHALKLRSVLTVPLIARGELLGVVYLDDRMRRAAFGTREVQWAQTVAPVAALAISDATTQDQLRRAVRRAERQSRHLERTLAHKETALDLAERELAKTIGARATRFRYDEIIGQSEPMRAMLQLLDRISVADVPVLLRGESGSGKELVARAIHRHSPRGSAPFVGENCGALPEPLLESALFGHARGAFTGALRSRVGLFEAADGGSLFLDEIGEMSLAMQTKLLRVLEDGLVRPLGAVRARQVDVRIIAATHRDLEQMVSDGAFREDLYYRLNVVAVAIPPLRERPSDIPLLVRHLLEKHGGGTEAQLAPRAMRALLQAPWPGNVRQLENEIRRALLLSDGPIDSEHLTCAEPAAEVGAEPGLNIRTNVDRLEAELVREALSQTGGNQTQAAKLLGISRYGLHKMMKRLAITPR